MGKLWMLVLLGLGGCMVRPNDLPQIQPDQVVIAYRLEVWRADNQWWDTAIYIGQGFQSPVHTDLILPDGRVFTSAPGMGVGFVDRDYAAEAGWWHFEVLTVGAEQAATISNWCEQAIEKRIADGSGYDYWGIARFLIPFIPEHAADYFCSEAVITAIQQGGFLVGYKPWRISPARLFRIPKVLP